MEEHEQKKKSNNALSFGQALCVLIWIICLISLAISYYLSYKETQRLHSYLEKNKVLESWRLEQQLKEKEDEIAILKRQIEDLVKNREGQLRTQ